MKLLDVSKVIVMYGIVIINTVKLLLNMELVTLQCEGC